MRIFTAFAVFLAGCGTAAASGGLDCEANDAKVGFAVRAGVTRGMGGPIFQFDGQVTIKDDSVSADLRKTAFALEHVAQYWFDADDLRLDLYRERDGDKPHGSVELIIKTKAGEEGLFAGSYELQVYDTVGEGAESKEAKFTGTVNCITE